MPTSSRRTAPGPRIVRPAAGYATGGPTAALAEQLTERAFARLGQALLGDPADPWQVTALPPLFLDMITRQYQLPAERCVDDCAVLAYAYAELGISAQLRVAVLSITDPESTERAVHGCLLPQWRDGLFDGHAVVWLAQSGHLVDITVEQYPQIDRLRAGPVIAARHADPAAGASAGQDAGDGRVRLRVRHDRAQLTYTLAPVTATEVMLNHPVMQAEAANHRRRGINIASEIVAGLAQALSPEQIGQIPHPRVAALVQAVRGRPTHESESGDIRFLLPGPAAAGLSSTRLDQVPLPAGTPPPHPGPGLDRSRVIGADTAASQAAAADSHR